MSREKDPQGASTVSRRSFIKGTSTVVSGLAIANSLPGCASTEEALADGGGNLEKVASVAASELDVVLNINGEDVSLTIEARVTLAEALRDYVGLTGTKVGCDRAACGACTVQLNGKSVLGCSILAVEAVDQEITTIEGLAVGGALSELQSAFVKNDALQCGFCTAGMIMSCKALLDQNPTPDLQQVKDGVAGNICRCGTYTRVFQAVLDTAAGR